MRYLIISLLFLCTAVSAVTPSLLPADESVTPEATAPNPLSLLGKWWLYVDISHTNLFERIEYVKETSRKSIEYANPELKLELNNLVQQINAALDGLVATKSAVVEELTPLNTDKIFYTITELQSLLNSYRLYESKKLQLAAVDRDEEAIAKKAEQNANEISLIYRKSESNSEQKLRLGIILMANRLSWYLWKV